MILPPYTAIAQTIAVLCGSGMKTATKYISEKRVAKATYQHKPSGRSRGETLIITYGQPNYLERQFIKLCKKAGETFPVRKVQLKPWPKKRVKS